MNTWILKMVSILVTLSVAMLSGCTTGGPSVGMAPVCKGVYAMVGQEISAKYDITASRVVAGNIVAAAEADVAHLKGLKEAKVDVSGDAKLGEELKAVVETKAKVTTDFFQQDQSFAQAACFFESVLDESNLTPEDRAFFEKKRQALAENRVSYLDVLTGLKKK